MKKTLFTINLLLMSLFMMAQAPNSFNYQAAVRDADGEILANKLVSFRISILETSATGTAVYTETHNVTTNEYGLINLAIGNGTVSAGTFSTIDWGTKSHFIRTELDANGGTSYTVMSTQQLMSVPYALSVANDKVDDADADVTNELQTISKSANTITLSNGGGTFTDDINDADADATNEIQVISKAGNVISLSKSGGAITLDLADEIKDTDGDTKIVVEQTTDDDMIRFYQEGTEFFRMDSGRLEIMNTQNNVAIGQAALASRTFGTDNIAIGSNSMSDADSGTGNTAIGAYALIKNKGDYNTTVGQGSMQKNTTGADNVAMGSVSLLENTTGSFNTALGSQAMRLSKSGDRNVAIGTFSLYNNNIGNSNTSVGQASMVNNTTGNLNSALGYSALYTNTTGSSNIAVGRNALFKNTTGSFNIAIGDSALSTNLTAPNNIAIGNKALINNSGSENTAVGSFALSAQTNTIRNTSVGYKAGELATGSFSTFMGVEAGPDLTTGQANVLIGRNAGSSLTTGSYNTALGYANSIASTVIYGIAIGSGTNVTASYQARIGTSTMTSIGGQVGWTTVSDSMFKTNVQENVQGLDFILKLRPVTYNLKTDEIAKFLKEDANAEADGGVSQETIDGRKAKAAMTQTGFIAQEVETAAQELGYDFSGVDAPKNENDFYGLRYAEFVVPLVKGMQEQQALIEAQQAEIEELKALVFKLIEAQEAE